MRLTFYGVRGSIPTPGAAYVRYGGNTACVHIELEDGTDIILDSGTGIRLLGDSLIKKNSPIYLLLSHNHWDHIQGFPFFAPIYQESREINIYPGLTQLNEPDQILNQMEGSLFPVPKSALKSAINLIELPAAQNRFTIGSATITRLAMNHPGSGSAYCIKADGVKIAYITDNELYPPWSFTYFYARRVRERYASLCVSRAFRRSDCCGHWWRLPKRYCSAGRCAYSALSRGWCD